jgi:hypothetical protein
MPDTDLTEPITDSWDAALDECMMMARRVLSVSPEPSSADEAAYLASSWIELGQLIATRQRNEFDFGQVDVAADEDEVEVE